MTGTTPRGDLSQFDLLQPGAIHLVIGRPESGVSTALAWTCLAAADAGVPAVLASWERPPEGWDGMFDRTGVALPRIMNWDLGELSRCPAVDGLDEGGVLAIDYLQLINPPDDIDEFVAAIALISTNRCWRVAVGVMAPRELACVEAGLPPRRALAAVRRVLGPVVDQAASMTIFTGPPLVSPPVLASQRSGSWHVSQP